MKIYQSKMACTARPLFAIVLLKRVYAMSDRILGSTHLTRGLLRRCSLVIRCL